jgi:GT2 family glycosyltransferase
MKDCFINHGCDLVLIINNDVVFHPEAIDRIVDEFGKQPSEIVMITAMNVRDECGGNPDNLLTLDISKYETLESPESPDFSGFMVNKKFLDEVGEADEGFGLSYHEDNDLHRRVRLAGLNAIKCPSALYFHYGSRTRAEAGGGFTEISHQSFRNSRDYFTRKWGGPPEPDGQLRDRLWTHPFNDESKNWKYTKQQEDFK